MLNNSNTAVIGAFVLLLALLGCATFLVSTGDIDGNTYMAVVVGPLVGGLVGFVAGTKGVQQGSAASTDPPPDA